MRSSGVSATLTAPFPSKHRIGFTEVPYQRARDLSGSSGTATRLEGWAVIISRGQIKILSVKTRPLKRHTIPAKLGVCPLYHVMRCQQASWGCCNTSCLGRGSSTPRPSRFSHLASTRGGSKLRLVLTTFGVSHTTVHVSVVRIILLADKRA